MSTRVIQDLGIYPGQRLVTRAGTTRTVAFVAPSGVVWVFGPSGVPEPATPVCDAWGGEHDLRAVQEAA